MKVYRSYSADFTENGHIQCFFLMYCLVSPNRVIVSPQSKHQFADEAPDVANVNTNERGDD